MQKSRLRAAILNAANRNAALVIKNAKIVKIITNIAILILKIVLPCLSTLHSVAILFKNCIKTGSYPPSYPHSHYFMLTNPHLFVKKLSNFADVFPLRFWRFARFFPIFPRRFCLETDKLSFFGRISTFFAT